MLNVNKMQTNENIKQLQRIITKMPIEVCCKTVLPEMGVHWEQLSRAVRDARMPMTPASIAQVLCRNAVKSLTQDELEDILKRLRLTLISTQKRMWHVIRLHEPTSEEPVSELVRELPHRVLQALRGIKGKQGRMRPQVESIMTGDLIYLSIQFVFGTKSSSVLYMATPPGEPVALMSSVTSPKILQACAEGVGYAKYEIANLHGKDIPSLLRISNPLFNNHADHLTNLPPYQPTPCILPNGIDYTNKTYDEEYVNNILGPSPPLLTELNLTTQKYFFDTSVNKTMHLKVNLKSDNVAKTLKTWVMKGALAPTSDFFQVFHRLKSNNIVYNREDSD